jgi:thioredoxin reductase (NADPH)
MYDCLIIGGGPAGLTAAVYLARYRRTVRLIDAGESRARLIPTSHNCPGFKGVSGEELLQRLREQTLQYQVRVDRGTVDELSRDGENFRVRAGEEELWARAIILATGLVDKEPKFKVLGGDPREVVRYCPICDGYEALDLTVAVLGGKEAAKKACFIRTFTKDVLWFSEGLAEAMPAEAQSLDVKYQGRVARVETSPNGVAITTTEGVRHHADLLYPALGCDVRSGLATALGARCAPIGTLIVEGHQQTTVDGLYAIGDVVSDLHQIAVATGHAAVAATAVHNRLPRNPR